jgi:hypothetical protein
LEERSRLPPGDTHTPEAIPERSAEHYDYLALVHGMLWRAHTTDSITENNEDACEDLNEMTDVIDGMHLD